MSDIYRRMSNLSPEKRSALEALLARKEKKPPQPEAIPLRQDSHANPLSFGQERLWFLDQMDPGNPFYNIPIAMRLRGALHVAALEQAFNQVVRRHEVLRTTFTMIEGQPAQVVAPALSLPLPILDLQELPAAEQASTAERLVAEEAQQPFDLRHGPLLRVKLFRLGQEQHILVVTIHHSIADGWSAGILTGEIALLYDALVAEKPALLPELPIQYADFASWQRQWLQGERRAAHLAYWEERLNNLPTLELPTDRPRAQTRSTRGAMQVATYSPATIAALRQLGRQEGATLFMILFAAFNVLLSRYTRQRDIVVGTLVAGRTRIETEPLIGFFVNPLVLRTDVSGDPCFVDLVRQVRKRTAEAYAHQELPFEQVVKHLQPTRDLSRQPLFQVMFSLQSNRLSALRIPGLELEPFEIDTGATRYDLDLSIREDNDSVSGFLYYDTDLFQSTTIARFLKHFDALLESIAQNPNQPISQLSCLSDEDTLVIQNINNTQVPYPENSSIQAMFEAQVEQTPDDVVAIIDDDQAGEYQAGVLRASMTYREMNDQANQLARYLRSLGVRPEVMVGVFLERSPRTLMVLLAILKAGGVYVPLDPTYPQQHLAFLIEDTRVSVLLTRQGLLERLPPHQAGVVCLDREQFSVGQQCTCNLDHPVMPDQLAYVMYTSGSTGRPKGVAVTQRQLLNRFAWMWRTWPFQPGEVACQRTALNFSVSIWELLGPVLQGAPILIVPDVVVKDPLRFIQTLARAQVTRIVVVPSLLRTLLENDLDLGRLLPALKLWSVCGEPLSPALVQRFKARLPHATLLNQYGASEVNDAAWYDTDRLPPDAQRIPIGRPIDNVQIYLLDQYLQPVPIGVPGEMYIGSVGLARGYLHRPDLTAERFVPNPFSCSPGARLYRPGDVGRYLPDAVIEISGRSDHQVKVRGMRVELGHVAAVLAQHAAVHQVVVDARDEPALGKQLVAYVVPVAGRILFASDLRAFLAPRLPHYMIPAVFVFLEALPLTPNGKLDRKALPDRQQRSLSSTRLLQLLERVERLSEAEATEQLNQLRTKGRL